MPTFFVAAAGPLSRGDHTPMDGHQAIERRIEQALAEALPEVDLLELTVLGRADSARLRLVIDHPAGVDHALCAEVTGVLDRAGLLDRFGAEVWSPGPEPPLRRPEHFRRAIGRRVKVSAEGPDGRSSHTGTLVEVDDRALRLSAGDGVVEIPFSEVRRARALESAEASR